MTAPAVPPTGNLALGRHLAMTPCSERHGSALDGWPGDDEAPPLVVAKGYTLDLFTRLLRTGITVSGLKSKTGRMSEMGRQRFPVMTDEALRALKAFLDARPTGLAGASVPLRRPRFAQPSTAIRPCTGSRFSSRSCAARSAFSA